MPFVVGALKVILGAFLLFTIARTTYSVLVPRYGWRWVFLVATLALANMLFHRWLGSTINPPFFTAVFFGLTIVGIVPSNPAVGGPVTDSTRWPRRGLIALGIGTVVGWLFYGHFVLN